MNKVSIMGRLTRDPEVAKAGETLKARYTVAVDRPKRSKDAETKTDFIPVVAWGKTAEFVEKYLKKGTLIIVNGFFETGSYKNKDGNTVYTYNVNAQEHEFVPGTGSKNSSSESSSAAPTQDSAPSEPDFMDVPDEEELPFN